MLYRAPALMVHPVVSTEAWVDVDALPSTTTAEPTAGVLLVLAVMVELNKSPFF